MLRKTHIATSEMIYTGACLAIHPTPMMYALGGLGVALGAQLPDVDNPNSRIARNLGIIGKIFAPIQHRTFTHTIWATAIIGSLFFFINQLQQPYAIHPMTLFGLTIYPAGVFWLGVTIGYFLHLFEDSWSVQGVGWFYPIGKKPRQYHGIPFFHRKSHWFYYHTGSGVESAMLVIFNIGWAVSLFYMFLQWKG